MQRIFLLIILTVLFKGIFAQQSIETKTYEISWLANDYLEYDGKSRIERLYFEDAWFENELDVVPVFHDLIPVHDDRISASVIVHPIQVEPLEISSLGLIDISELDTFFVARTAILTAREQPMMRLLVNTLRIHPVSGVVEKLLSFKISLSFEKAHFLKSDEPGFANNSVLATGNWTKIRISESGVYKISHAELQAFGINPGAIDPRNIRLFGNGGGTLPESNSDFRHDDLAENAIIVVGEEDGVFNSTDYILFYGQGPVKWFYDLASSTYKHTNNYYDDYAYFFITTDHGSGKRIQTNTTTGVASEVITEFLDSQIHEQDLENLSNTGRTWFGELFDAQLSRDFVFDFPNAIPSRNARLSAEVAGRAFGASNFQLSIDGQLVRTLSIDATQATGYDYAKGAQTIVDFYPGGDLITVNLKYNRSIASARGWLDYISVNIWRNLIFSGSQMHFRNFDFLPENNFFEYKLSGSDAQVEIWDITDPTETERMQTSLQGSVLTFKAAGDIRRSFIAFDKSSFLTAESVGVVANQNLHSVRDVDYLIITHPEFLEQANRLAELHRERSGLVVYVTIPELIYNEFSSGAQDVTGIRDFARMLFSESNPGRKLRYLLLFGDASFDYKDKLPSNTNFVPTYETITSLNLVNSIATDDYFGYLDINEGGGANSLLDIGIGRFPVSTPEQAAFLVDKIVRYLDNNDETMGPWRNDITLVADDGDTNGHLRDAENLASLIDEDYPDFNVDKIYLDAYRQVATPGGQKAPDVNEAINKRMERGSLFVNYSGHGGEVGWTEERILEIADIISWRNRNKMPVFITATCEFSRYDDPTRLSAGEMVFLNQNGGAIAMFTTARATYAATNLRLNKAIFKDNIFVKEGGEYPRFGDVIRRSKLTGDANDRKFVLLGDPGLSLTFPKLRVKTSHINGQPVGSVPDTLKALDNITINGFITDEYDVPLSDYNGIVYATVFDKINTITTLGDQNPVTTFSLRNSVIYKGKVEVKDGQFDFSFMMPKDIAYRFGGGRISYFATDFERDAQGHYEDFIIGGYSNNIVDDENGPQIRLFMGDTTFKSGGFTSENPVLIAVLADESGINTTGAGIGHDIVAVLSGATEKYAILNDFYSATLNKSSEGVVTYPFFNLNPGHHTLTLKAWDILNNSSSVSIEFEVIPGSQITIDNLMNYPNPFVNETYFVFNHNQQSENLDVEIKIYNVNGSLVRSIVKKNNFSTSSRNEPILWDGTNDSGQHIPKGLYIYRLIVTNTQGKQTEKRSKLLYYR